MDFCGVGDCFFVEGKDGAFNFWGGRRLDGGGSGKAVFIRDGSGFCMRVLGLRLFWAGKVNVDAPAFADAFDVETFA